MIAAVLLTERAQREKLFPRLHESEWLILLDLVAAQRPLSVSALCTNPYVPATTSLRHIERLVDRGFVERIPDAEDRRRVHVLPTALALGKLEQFAAVTGRSAPIREAA